MKDVYDYFAFGDPDELAYERVSGGYGDYNCKFTEASWIANRDLEYCGLCFTNSSLFGCVGLRNKKFCILNKQYSESEYLELSRKIRNQMIKAGEYGEFFSIVVSPFSYWDSVAQEHFPLSKEEILRKGYNWRERVNRNPAISKHSNVLPDDIGEVSDEILNEVIECEHEGECVHQCTAAYRITSAELKFYREQNIPLPTLCYQCRHASRVALRNPLRLWHRRCMCDKSNHSHDGKCSNEFETSYAPDRPEIVYCESCYNKEVA
jgi:hypothetical protein